MCRPLSLPPAADLDCQTTIDGLMGLFDASPENDRNYCKLNLGAYYRHGTVEFRQHQGTIDATKISNWIRLCLRQVAYAALNQEPARPPQPTFTPPPPPRLPPPPIYPEDPIDPTTAPNIPAARLVAGYHRYGWVIGYIRSYNPHRPGTNLYNNWHNYRPGLSCRQYRATGHWLSLLRRDAAAGNITIIDPAAARRAPPTPSVLAERAAARALHTAEVSRLRAAHDAATTAARAAFDAAHPQPDLNSTRPPTDAAPATLEGLLALIGAAPQEQAYFTERQLELNP